MLGQRVDSSLAYDCNIEQRKLSEVVNGPLKSQKSQEILPKSRNIAQPTDGLGF